MAKRKIAEKSAERPASGEVNRYLLIALNGQSFAIPLDRVIGVVESTQVTPIPFSPPPFEGLVLAMGQVVPQISLAALLDMKQNIGGVVVLISDLGGSIGLRVDQVHSMQQIERDLVDWADPEQRIDNPLLLGRFTVGDHQHAILDLATVTSDRGNLTLAERGAVMLAPETAAQVVEDDDVIPENVEPYLMIGVSGDIYAVKVDALVELLELSSLRPVPHAPAWISGMIDRRGDPVLGLSLAALLGRPIADGGRLGMVITTADGPLVLVADQSYAIERFAPEHVHPMREPVAGVASYLVKADGAIVAIIDPESLLRPIATELSGWVPQSPPVESTGASVKPMEFLQYLTLRVGREYLAVPLDRIQRLQASVKLTPIPDRGTGFDALADVGDAVVPVIDLRRSLASGEESDSTTPPPCLLAMIEGGIAGILVSQVLRIETVPVSQITIAEQVEHLPVSHIVHLQDQLMSVVALDRLLPPL